MVNVVFITDNNYASVTGTAITSLKINRNINRKYCVYVVVIDMPEENIRKFKTMEESGFNVSVIEADLRYTEYKTAAHPSKATYTRFYLAELLADLDKAIYLDDDIIVQHDISDLFELDLEDCYVAASREIYAEVKVPSYMEKLHSKLPFYFNAGVMVLNLKKWREDNISEKLVHYLHTGLNFLGNQDAFNIVFDGKVKYVSCLWNFLVFYLKKYPAKNLEKYYEIVGKDGITDFIKDSHILHFAGVTRPWEEYQYYLTDLYMSYYEKSPFKYDNTFSLYQNGKKESQYIFPFKEVGVNSKIILYGAGAVGKSYYIQIRKTEYCEVVAWMDSCYEKINSKQMTEEDYFIQNPQKLKDYEFDFCVIAVLQENVAINIKNSLIESGVPERKIVWRYPKYFIEV